ncbi:ABC-type bacteriocin/lantibiotic exporter, contains an N-terminal double-glycine peptidase domain [Sulfitobacter litoralis]|uniref:ABC-type bacteriocin/lantibiotic exporter, contains an N-terminal double-glycine peptidase domain n=1 Tax=Sulfitobacter litoralis TaxID=335975 RepID=A0ABY0SUF2_9RHOB|nr:ABC-type bacteriocin/lantibiotic exporter, contains an N-terminal double-glycine peptidase domain [Sulfitobacter litoralis]
MKKKANLVIDSTAWKKAWALLDARERRNAWITLAMIVVSAIFSAGMVGSIFPFLSVLADPTKIETNEFFSWAYTRFGFNSDYGFLVALGMAALTFIVIGNVMQVLRTYVVSRFTTLRVHSFSYRLLSVYLRQPYEFFLQEHSGSMSTKILAESGQVISQFFTPAANLVTGALTSAAIVSVVIAVNPVVALLAFTVIGGVYGATYGFSRIVLRRLGQARLAANKQRFRFVNEALMAVKEIKLLGREASYVERYEKPSLIMAKVSVRSALISQVPQYVVQSIAFGGIIVLCLALLSPEQLSSGAALGGILPTLGVFAFAGQKLLPELGKLYQGLAKIQFGRAAVDSVYSDLFEKSSAEPLPRRMPLKMGLRDNLRLVDISYRYPNADIAGLYGLSLDIHAGEKVGIVGSTGAGKTTLADLILGLLRPSEGYIAVDGIEIAQENRRAWQQSVGYVPQDIFLTDASISENIALGVPPKEIDQARVCRAAEIARIDTFILQELTNGYDTHVGERGVRLSGGQRQRIGIARALYQDADLIVFDEATSALDNLTEHEVMSAIDTLPGDKTVLMIAHRLSTVKRCDRILVLDKGRLVGCDTWDALMATNPIFQKIAHVSDIA